MPSSSAPHGRPVPAWVLPALQITALLCLALRAGQYALAADATGGVFPTRLDIAWMSLLAATVLIALTWTVRARLAPGAARGVLSAAVLLILVLADGGGHLGFDIPALLLALALVVVDIGPVAGLLAALLLGIDAAVGHVQIGSDAATIVINALALAVLGTFGAAIGALWHGYQQTTEDLAAAMERQRRMADTQKELVLAEERARSARELHDTLGHRLTLIGMSLEYAERVGERDPSGARAEIATARTTAAEAMVEMRTWVRALSPVRDPDATGLLAINAIAESFRGTGLEVSVAHASDPFVVTMSEDAELLLYRAVQEGLTNALRHGRARRVCITTGRSEQTVRLEITSDLGAAARESLPEGPLAPGFGLRGLAERATALGGSVQARRAGDEVVLSIEIPTAGLATAGVPAQKGGVR